jgi:hypothetical protein
MISVTVSRKVITASRENLGIGIPIIKLISPPYTWSYTLWLKPGGLIRTRTFRNLCCERFDHGIVCYAMQRNLGRGRATMQSMVRSSSNNSNCNRNNCNSNNSSSNKLHRCAGQDSTIVAVPAANFSEDMECLF